MLCKKCVEMMEEKLKKIEAQIDELDNPKAKGVQKQISRLNNMHKTQDLKKELEIIKNLLAV
jgi:hypothetical protein